MITRIPGPLRFDYSTWDGSDVFVRDEHLATDRCIRDVLLTEKYQAGHSSEDDPAAMKKWRNKISDVQHLSAHLLAKHDARS